MTAERRTVEVWADFQGREGSALMGFLSATPARGKEIFSFEYDTNWLKAGRAQSLDPALRFLRGPQYLADGRDNFGLFLDSSPDRWGRLLLLRREALVARNAKRPERRLTELDFLLGVYDGHRMGGLRFRVNGGPFLDDNAELASPPWTSLRELEQASLSIERDGAETSPSFSKWVRMLIAPGRSLGGARPKASVVDQAGCLWIAKFPSARDMEDIGAWESVVHELAKKAGIQTTEARREKFGSAQHTFLSRRFDRTPDGSRIHFASAMTLLDKSDGEPGASYLDMADIIVRQGAHPERDLEELWRRVVFFMCVSNADDHLRNHGFLLEEQGWSLSPAYDMNPVAASDGLSLNVSESSNAQDLELARDVAKHFRVNASRANEIIEEVLGAVRGWRAEAKRAHISRSEQERMCSAFHLAET